MLAMMTLCASAVPAKRGLTKVLTLTDGTTVTARLVGDEHGHYWMADDGKAYLSVDGSDVFQPVDARQVMARAKEKRARENTRRTRKMAQRRVGEWGNYQGAKKGLIILVFHEKLSAKLHFPILAGTNISDFDLFTNKDLITCPKNFVW